tara:strand:- start:1823 stop:2371 length:549 start_codon:yes stop_codon:yes gene_type:complete
MIVMDNIKVMDISESFFDASQMGEGGSHSDFLWWDLKGDPITEKQIYIDKLLNILGVSKIGYAGVEYWWSTRVKGKGLKIHQDKDENLWKTESIMVHPKYSIISYPKYSHLVGGDFFFVDSKFGIGPYDWNSFNESMYQNISYKHQRLVVLDPGNQFHGVNEIHEGERHNFVINLWDRELKN